MAGLVDLLTDSMMEKLETEKVKLRAEVKKEIVGAMFVAVVVAYFLSKEL